LKRKAEAGLTAREILREKRMGDMAWQMNFTAQKLKNYRGCDPSAKENLKRLHREAKRAYDRLQAQIEIEAAADKFSIFLG
jgi:hypothetical protein